MVNGYVHTLCLVEIFPLYMCRKISDFFTYHMHLTILTRIFKYAYAFPTSIYPTH